MLRRILRKRVLLSLKWIVLLTFAFLALGWMPVGLAAPVNTLPVAGVLTEVPTEVPTETKPLRIDGPSDMTAINQLLKQRYQERFPGSEVRLNAKGTERALQELRDGEIDLAAIGRPLTAIEQGQGLRVIPISRDKIAIVVGQENPFRGALTLEQRYAVGFTAVPNSSA
jgi:ABC-type phosphate transport system substrate-binding protein